MFAFIFRQLKQISQQYIIIDCKINNFLEAFKHTLNGAFHFHAMHLFNLNAKNKTHTLKRCELHLFVIAVMYSCWFCIPYQLGSRDDIHYIALGIECTHHMKLQYINTLLVFHLFTELVNFAQVYLASTYRRIIIALL